MTVTSRRRSAIAKTTIAASAALSILCGGLAGAVPALAAPGDVVNPLDSKTYRYSSEFGPRCIPVVNGSTNHLGQDLAASDGNTIRAIADGVVHAIGQPTNGGAGYLVVRHNIDGKTIYSAYMHMWNPAKYVKKGQVVKKGERIALVGNSGPSTAAHLHFEIWENTWYTGKAVNPTVWMKTQGVDLKAGATLVYNYSKPTSCTYYFGNDTVLRATASSTGTVIKNVSRNDSMTSVPGNASQSGNFVKVTSGGVTGWAARSLVYPNRVSAPATPATPAATVGTTAANVTYKTTDNLNVRTGASTAYGIVKNLPKGTQAQTTGKAVGGWFEITSGSTTGWVNSFYLSKVSTPAPAQSVVAKTNATLGYTSSLRSTANSAGKILTTLAKGTNVYKTGQVSGNWVKIQANGQTGWVTSAQVGSTTTVKAAATAKPAAPTVVKASAKTNATLGYTSSLRLAAGSNSKIITTLTKGTNVYKTGQVSGNWVKIQVNGKTGWVTSAQVKAQAATSKTVSAAKVSATMKTTGKVHLRLAASASSKSLGVVKKGTTVTEIGKSSNGWVKVKFGSATGWISGAFLK